MHTRVRNAVTLVWGSLRLAPIILGVHTHRKSHVQNKPGHYCRDTKHTYSRVAGNWIGNFR